MESGDGTERGKAGSERDALLLGHLYGELSEQEEARLDQALAHDPDLAEDMEQFGRILDAYRSLPAEEPPDHIADAVLAAAAAQVVRSDERQRDFGTVMSTREGQDSSRLVQPDVSHERGAGLRGWWAWLLSFLTVPRRRVGLAVAFSVFVALGAGLILWQDHRRGLSPQSRSSVKKGSVAMKEASSGRPVREQDESLGSVSGGMEEERRDRLSAADSAALGQGKRLEKKNTESPAPKTSILEGRSKQKVESVGGLGRRTGAAERGVVGSGRMALGGGSLRRRRTRRSLSPMPAAMARRGLERAAPNRKGFGAPAPGAAVGVATMDAVASERSASSGQSRRVAAARLLRAGQYGKALVLYRQLGVQTRFSKDPLFLLEWAEAELVAGSLSRTISLAKRVEKTSRKLRPRALALKRRAQRRRVMRARTARDRRARRSKSVNALEGL